MDNAGPQKTTGTDVCAFLCSNIRHKARLARTWPKLLLISLAVDHSLFMGLFPNNWKIRDFFNSSFNVYKCMIQPKSILADLQDSFLFPVYVILSFSIFSSRHLRRPWCSWFSCHLATERKWLCFFSHQTNFYTLLENSFSFFFFKPKFVISISSGRHLYSSCRYTLEMFYNIKYSQTNLASGKLLCRQIMKYQHRHWRYEDAVS